MKISSISDLASEFNLERVAARLEALARPSILIGTEVVDGPLDAAGSRIGGLPALPAGVTWPLDRSGLPMSFLAQLNLKDLATLPAGGLLPESGHLYFFYDSQQSTWGFDPNDRGAWKVIFSPDRAAKFSEPPQGLPDDAQFIACSLTFSEDVTLPCHDAAAMAPLDLSEAESDDYCRLRDSISSHAGDPFLTSRLFGYPDAVQNADMDLECQLVTSGVNMGGCSGWEESREKALAEGPDRWQLLFQLGSHDEAAMMWGDCGLLYFWIETEALKRQDFSNVWLILQCF